MSGLTEFGQREPVGALEAGPEEFGMGYGPTVRDAITRRRAEFEQRRASMLAQRQAEEQDRTAYGALEAPMAGTADWMTDATLNPGASPGPVPNAAAGIPPPPPPSGVMGPPRPPRARGARPGAPAPAGALSIGTDPWEGAVADSANQNAALATAGALEGGMPASAPAAPRRSLGDRYAELTKGIDRGKGDALTADQKAQMQLDFFLGLMAKGSKRGSRLIGALGESGLEVSDKMRKQSETNKADARAARGEARDDAFRQVSFDDKDEDNQRAVRQLGMTEAHYKAMDVRDRERLVLETKKLEADGKRPHGSQVLANGNIGIITSSGVQDSGVKARVPKERDDTPAELRVLKALQADPALAEMYRNMHGKREGAITEKDLAEFFLKANHGNTDPGDPTDVASRAVDFARGGGKRPLPKGVPPGSVQIGTSKGKPVYKTPEGKQVIVE